MKVIRYCLIDSVALARPTTCRGVGLLNRLQFLHCDTTSIIILPVCVLNNPAFLINLFIFSIVACPNCLWILVTCALHCSFDKSFSTYKISSISLQLLDGEMSMH